MPTVRKFAPIVAGIGAMRYKTFMAYNLVCGFVWTFGIMLLGYFLGQVIPDVDKYLLPIIVLIIIISVAPSIIHLIQENKAGKNG